MPGMSVMLVVSRSTTAGLLHGVFVTMGIVVGDLLFILAAIFGLALLANAMGELFVAVRIVGGAYLIWLGISLLKSNERETQADAPTGQSSLLASFLSGLMLTLGDQKAIFFYLGFLPAFIDLTVMTMGDIVLVMLVTVVSVGGVKLAYAYAAVRAGLLLGGDRYIWLYRLAGSVLILIGAYMLITTLAGASYADGFR